MNKHTPGPWSVVQKVPVSQKVGGGINWAYKIQRGKYSTEVTVEADALLIAAAPDLLRTLENLVKAANQDNIDPLAMFIAIEQARHVIDKAEGRAE